MPCSRASAVEFIAACSSVRGWSSGRSKRRSEEKWRVASGGTSRRHAAPGWNDMKGLTHGSTAGHILSMAPPIVIGMITIMICQLVDLYFVAGLGEAAIAGVAAAGNAGFLVNALMQ